MPPRGQRRVGFLMAVDLLGDPLLHLEAVFEAYEVAVGVFGFDAFMAGMTTFSSALRTWS